MTGFSLSPPPLLEHLLSTMATARRHGSMRSSGSAVDSYAAPLAVETDEEAAMGYHPAPFDTSGVRVRTTLCVLEWVLEWVLECVC
jgi:hypothetical protein